MLHPEFLQWARRATCLTVRNGAENEIRKGWASGHPAPGTLLNQRSSQSTQQSVRQGSQRMEEVQLARVDSTPDARTNRRTNSPIPSPPILSTYSTINHPNLSGMHNWRVQLHGRWRVRAVAGRCRARQPHKRQIELGKVRRWLKWPFEPDAGGGCLKS